MSEPSAPGNIDKDVTRQAIEMLYFGYRNFTLQADRELEKRGLNRSHHRILYFISRNGETLQSDLLATLKISKQALNLPLRQLVSMDLVTISRAKTDGRVKLVKLTKEGKRLEQRLTRHQRGLLDEVFAMAGSRNQEGWFRVMELLAES